MKRNLSFAKQAVCKDIQNAVASPLFTSLNMPEHNALVSNIVGIARFTPEEAALLGLTNIVEQADFCCAGGAAK